MKPWQFLSVLSLLVPCAVAQVTGPIRDLMSPQERQATGVDALNPAQLEALNRWLQQRGASEPEAAPSPAGTATPCSISTTVRPTSSADQAVGVRN